MVTNPINTLLVQIEVAFLLGFLVSFPLLFYKIVNFVNVGLYANEKRLLRGVILSGIPLFFAGCVFSYLVIISLTLNLSYTYIQVMGVIPFFEVQKLLIILLVIVILLFGGKKISEIARSAGRATGEFKKWRIEAEQEVKKLKDEITKTEENKGGEKNAS